MKVVIIGFGLIGRERYNALRELQHVGFPINEIGVYDPYIPEENKYNSGIIWFESLKEIEENNPDWVIVCTPHDVAVEIVKIVSKWACSILMEKPFGRNYKEALELDSLFNNDLINRCYVGFNYRFYPGIQKIYADYRNGLFGEIINVNCEIGHGGNPDDANTWKSSPEFNGSGALCDPGIHMLDLLNQFCIYGIVPKYGTAYKGVWNTGIQEEVNLILTSKNPVDGKNFSINLKSSLVHWRSTFRFEIWGDKGYGIVTGRGRSYGPMEYVRGEKWGWKKGVSQRESEQLVSLSTCELSFYDELKALFFEKNDHKGNLVHRLEPCNSFEALLDMKLYEDCFGIII